MSLFEHMAKAECTCPPEHTVAKLGHCRSCDAYPPTHSLRPEDVVAEHLINEDGPVTVFVCGVDVCSVAFQPGSKHDFNWATYADDRESYGVCKCGMSSMHYDMLRLP